MSSNFITRLDLHNRLMGIKFKSPTERMEYLVDFLVRRFDLGQFDDAIRSLREFVRISFLLPYLQRWNRSSRNKKTFLKRNNAWLMESMNFPDTVRQYLPSTSAETSKYHPVKTFLFH